VQGKKGANNTCHFSTSLTLHPEQKAVEERQIGFDAATWTLKMERVASFVVAIALTAPRALIKGLMRAHRRFKRR